MVGNIPEETTSFVGRRTELILLERALAEHRLVTLTGGGGVGKSRLALRAAERAARRAAGRPAGPPDGPPDPLPRAGRADTGTGAAHQGAGSGAGAGHPGAGSSRSTGSGAGRRGAGPGTGAGAWAGRRERLHHPDGAWWADLSPLYDERLLLSTVSDAVGLYDHSLRMPIEALCEWLAPRRLLLVLDSCERLAPACAHLVGELLTAAPGLTVLATSRQPLGTKGEHVVEVRPLPLDNDDAVLQLFRDRAARSAPRISLEDPRHAAAAVRICHQLEGIPLAVELACARLADNSVEEIADRLVSRLDGLTATLRPGAHTGVPTGSRTTSHTTSPAGTHTTSPAGTHTTSPTDTRDGTPAGPRTDTRTGSRTDTPRLDLLTDETRWPQRHRALRTAVGWSHELCAPLERLLWARLSVFRGEVDEADARAVCAGGPLSADAVGTALNGLVGQSVVRREGTRYRMLDTLREYGGMWLDELGEARALADRHAARFADLVRRAHDGWAGPEQVAWYARIADSHADLCAALDHLLVADPPAALEMAGRVGFFWSCSGHLHEARGYLERALDGDPTAGPQRTRAIWALGVTVLLQGDARGAHRLGERCGVAAWHDQHPESMLSAAYLLSLSCLMMGRAQAAHTVADRALRAHPGDAFDSPSQLRCRLARVFALTALDRLDEAGEEAGELRRACLDHGERWTRAYADYQLALVHLLQDRPYEAEAHARSMIAGKELVRDSFGIALGLDLLAAGIAAQGDGERAAYAYGTGQAFWRMVGHPRRGTPELAAVRSECERQARAAAGDPAYEEAFRRGLAGDGTRGLARVLEGRLPPGELRTPP
ncbi:ATP-binding protein [Streptomyces hebeiensis]